jgi:hypothetical protein
MIYKVVKDATGKVVAFGSGDGYEPFIAQGHTLELIENYVHVPSIEEHIASFENAIQQHLDNEAQLKGYDNITNACSYAGAPNPFQAEAQSFITWRGNVWAYCYGELAKVQAGTRPMPTIAQIISELPVRV